MELLPKAELCPVTGWLELPEEIELTVRTNEKNGRSYAFLLNYTAQPQTVTVQKPTKEAAYTRNARRHIYHGTLRRACAR